MEQFAVYVYLVLIPMVVVLVFHVQTVLSLLVLELSSVIVAVVDGKHLTTKLVVNIVQLELTLLQTVNVHHALLEPLQLLLVNANALCVVLELNPILKIQNANCVLPDFILMVLNNVYLALLVR